MLKISSTLFLGKKSCCDKIQYKVMPTASAAYKDRIVQYVGTTDSTYTKGYFYECQGTTTNVGVPNFTPQAVTFDFVNNSLVDFFDENNISNPTSIVSGTMTYAEAGNLWAITGKDASDNVLFDDLALYTEDLEDAGFTFIIPLTDEMVIAYEIVWHESTSYTWIRINVQPE